MVVNEGTFRGPRNLRIHHRSWLPEAEARAALIILHGLGSHCGRYQTVVGRFVPRGIAVFGFDQIGHGLSEGVRGRIERFEDFSRTLGAFHRLVLEWEGGKPVFLFGHSMGGLVAAYHLLDHPTGFRGAVFSAPAVKISRRISPARIAAGLVLSAVAPGMGVMRMNAAALSRDPDAQRAYRADPLVHHGKTSARLAAEILRAARRAAREAHRITLPFLAFQGGEDGIVDPGAARLLYDRAASADKTLRIYDGMPHETFHGPGGEQVLGDMQRWIEARI
ncbi:MAG: lysophospholipase [Anaerolineales bacterium]|nr:lysophospholipase [Anaerolineales bacterium]